MDKKTKTTHSPLSYLFVALLLIITTVILVDPIKNFVQFQIKKQSLRTFYTQLSTAENQKNWSALYDFFPNSTKRFVSKDQYVIFQSKNPNIFYSSKTVINNVNGEAGIVNRTKTLCLTSECTGNNKIVDTSDKTYVYKNGNGIYRKMNRVKKL